MLDSFDSRVDVVLLVDFSISRRIVRLGVHRGRIMVVVVCWRRCRIVVMACRDGRWVRSGGVLEFSCETA
jgi:hypothetical protein